MSRNRRGSRGTGRSRNRKKKKSPEGGIVRHKRTVKFEDTFESEKPLGSKPGQKCLWIKSVFRVILGKAIANWLLGPQQQQV